MRKGAASWGGNVRFRDLQSARVKRTEDAIAQGLEGKENRINPFVAKS